MTFALETLYHLGHVPRTRGLLCAAHAQRVGDADVAVERDRAQMHDGRGRQHDVTSGPRYARVEAEMPAARHLDTDSKHVIGPRRRHDVPAADGSSTRGGSTVRQSDDGSAVSTSLVPGQLQAASVSIAWAETETDRQTDGSRYRLMPRPLQQEPA